MPSGKKKKRHKMSTHKRKKRLSCEANCLAGLFFV